MEEEEFNLSEKIEDIGKGTCCEILYLNSVKEFIKRLKELSYHTNLRSKARGKLVIDVKDLNTLAGDKLI